jgi:predicted phage baseplate assembly protein
MGTEVATTRTETKPAITFSTDLDAEIRVPRLKRVMTRSASGQINDINLQSLAQTSYSGFDVFGSRPPVPNDAMFLGFEEDLSHHILGLEMDVDLAGGAGVDPNNPPYVWEVMGKEEDSAWTPIEVDYDGTSAFNVNGVIRLHLPAMQAGERGGENAYWVRCRLAPQEGMHSFEISPRINRMVAASWGITVDTTNVMKVENEVLGRSEGTPGQRFFLEHTPVAPRLHNSEYIVVRPANGPAERWVEVADFADSTKEDRHYVLDSQSGEIRFGPALPQRDGSIHRYGHIPAVGSMIVMRSYRYGGGTEGNVAARTLNVLKSSIAFVDRVANREAAYGGLDAEDLEDAKVRVPGYLRSLQRAVTAGDFEYLAREAAPGAVGRVVCLQGEATAAGEVKVLVIPEIPNLQGYIAPESLALPDELRERIMAYLDERRLLATRLEVREPDYHWIRTEVRFHASEFFEGDEVREAVEAKLFAFLNPLTGGPKREGWPFGRELFVSDIMAALLNVPGVDFIRSVRLYPVTESGGRYVPGDEKTSIQLPPDGVIVSHQHDVREG